ncbi:aldehyde dehydrogenase family protein [Aurantiacibacter luteus]|uniref:Betaine-aldehyde dehydrogenase n=1 Tax=Aurantiacibacter luteus TaxID=1581420 RepID=A0A0G9MTL8_9SPHN|nr:aldehyde dehydrogenase family protein [Aurantiacibacter luteus]KLE34102.1 betaine-aldehyde dehydrogenase [Aurantiacibacter luteus]
MNEQTAIDRTQRDYSAAVKKALERKPQLYIDGAWVDSSGGETIEVEDPSSGKIVSRFVEATDKDIDRAVAAARTAFDDGRWRNMPPVMREKIMHKLADLIEEHADELAELEAIDVGKPKGMAAAVDVPGAASHIRFCASWASKITGETVAPYTMPGGMLFAYTLKEPVGVCAQIVPWNFPLLMACLKIGPALGAGCTTILKPAEQTSLTALRLADLVHEAGVPAGVFNLVTGYGHTGGDRLVKHPDVDKVAFTGSTEIGKLINKNATDTLKHVTLELGGKSPVVVMPDVDVASTGPGVAGAIFFNSGQVCVAGSRLYAHKSVFDDVIEGMHQTKDFWAPRPSLDPDAHMGPLVSKEQHERVMNYIEAGKRDGAAVLMGGDAPSSDGGYYVNPTILTDVNPQMSVVREEIFGPVVVAQRFEDLDDVVRDANDTQYGLAAGVWTKNLAAAHQIAAKLQAGTVWVNTHAMIDVAIPFGGYKESGVGREQGREGIEAYLQTKSVVMKMD